MVPGGPGKRHFPAAAYHGRLEVVKALLSAAADVDATGSFDGGPVHAAARAGHLEVLNTLLSAGADVNVKGSCAEGDSSRSQKAIVGQLRARAKVHFATEACLSAPIHHTSPWQQRLDIGRDISQRPLRAIAGQRTGHLGVGKPLRAGINAAADLDGRGGIAAGHVGARGVVRHEDHLAAEARRDRDAVERRGHVGGGASGVRDGNGHGDTLLGGHVEAVEPAIGAVGHQQGLAVGRGHEAAEALDGVVRGRLEVPGAGPAAVGGDAHQRAGEGADHKAGALGVVGDVLEAAVGAVGEGRQVGLPEDLVGGQVVLDEPVVAADVGA
ncbi:hypothetical protein PG994_008551 [Apiospora phragmitis]|uniref:Ankyrin repeat domain-containing protein n=1 Tax=Apiospora phragmitis TaxID=2905665 RepID=A0ABR1UGU3_9PEZI